MARTKAAEARRIYVATESFSFDLDGIPTIINAHKSFVEEGHPLLERYPDYFRLLEPHFKAPVAEDRWEMATAAPGEVRG